MPTKRRSKHALDDLKKQSSLFKVLGSYPWAVL